MAESVQVAVVVVFALLVGATIPVLLSLRTLLQRSARAVSSLEGRVGETLDKTNTILGRVDTLTKELEGSAEGVHNIVTTVNELSATLLQAQRALRVATAVAAAAGPAVAAFVHALKDRTVEGAEDEFEDEEGLDLGPTAPPVSGAGGPPRSGPLPPAP